MGLGILVLIMGTVICVHGWYCCERGREAERARRHVRGRRMPRQP